MPKCDFNKLRHGCSPVNLLHIFRTAWEHLWVAASVDHCGSGTGEPLRNSFTSNLSSTRIQAVTSDT